MYSRALRFLYAAAQLGLDPAHCVVVEDAPAGIKAAIAAGMWTIKLGTAVGAAHLVLPNLMGVHLSDLQTKLDRGLVLHDNNYKNGIVK